MKNLGKITKCCALYVVIFIIASFIHPIKCEAWESDTDRPGMDYKNFWIGQDVEAFVAVGQCEDACKNDPQCKAFTYVKPGVQGAQGRCYLKKGIPSAVKNNNCISGVVKPDTAAERCKSYATKAIQQNQSNIDWQCGYTGIRWSTNYQEHYDWCMKTAASLADHETAERKKLLDKCWQPSGSADLSAADLSAADLSAADLSAYNWCYNINEERGEITFHPIVKNESEKDWKSREKGHFKIGVTGPSGLKETTFILPSFPNWYLESHKTSTLEGLTVPYHPDKLYNIENLWSLSHSEDKNQKNNTNLGLKGLHKGINFKMNSPLICKQCSNNLLIVAHKSFLNALTPLKQHKESTGITTYIESWQSLDARFAGTGRDLPERIKMGIADYKKKNGIKWVMLVGDSDKFPVRYLCRDVPHPKGYQASDLYYADLFKSDGSFDTWDGNGNNLYGQVLGTSTDNNIDRVGWHPDVAIGRVPASNIGEVKTYVQKVIRYELNAFHSNWFKKALFATGGDFGGDAVKTSNYIARNYLDGFNIIKHYHTKTWQPYYPKVCPKDAATEFITSMMDKRAKPMTDYINQGLGFINYYGHGSWNDFCWVYDKRHLNDLTNRDKLPIIFSRACQTGEFAPSPPWQNYYDVENTFHAGHKPGKNEIVPIPNPIQPGIPVLYPGVKALHNCDLDARAEDWLVYRNTGAVAFIGCAGTSNPNHADALNKDFFKAYKLGFKTFGAMWMYMVQQFLDGHGYFDEQGNMIGSNDWERYTVWNALVRFNPFGDPSLRVGGVGEKVLKMKTGTIITPQKTPEKESGTEPAMAPQEAKVITPQETPEMKGADTGAETTPQTGEAISSEPRFDLFEKIEGDTDRPGNNYRNFDLEQPDVDFCLQACQNDPRCKAFTYVKPGLQGQKARCWLKDAVPEAKPSPGCISGVKK